MNEAVLQRLILAHASLLPQSYFWRASTGAMRTDDGRFLRFGQVGQSDIMGVVRGRAVFVEVKSSTGKLRESQEEFKRHVEAAGAVYLVAREFEPTMEILRAL